ncbi:hypothetical protein AERO9A_180075 [Aeromonas salmonicida]|nr:hypothetical protein AERO9A_180075 [Aeromonas salmonicida]
MQRRPSGRLLCMWVNRVPWPSAHGVTEAKGILRDAFCISVILIDWIGGGGLGIIDNRSFILVNTWSPRRDAEYAGRKVQRISGTCGLLLCGHPQRQSAVARTWR